MDARALFVITLAVTFISEHIDAKCKSVIFFAFGGIDINQLKGRWGIPPFHARPWRVAINTILNLQRNRTLKRRVFFIHRNDAIECPAAIKHRRSAFDDFNLLGVFHRDRIPFDISYIW